MADTITLHLTPQERAEVLKVLQRSREQARDTDAEVVDLDTRRGTRQAVGNDKW
jgi:hypothetical protein